MQHAMGAHAFWTLFQLFPNLFYSLFMFAHSNKNQRTKPVNLKSVYPCVNTFQGTGAKRYAPEWHFYWFARKLCGFCLPREKKLGHRTEGKLLRFRSIASVWITNVFIRTNKKFILIQKPMHFECRANGTSWQRSFSIEFNILPCAPSNRFHQQLFLFEIIFES